jgi:hypothetical protein
VGKLIDPSKENYCAFLGYVIEEGATGSVDFGEVLRRGGDYDPTEASADGIGTQQAIKAPDVAC